MNLKAKAQRLIELRENATKGEWLEYNNRLYVLGEYGPMHDLESHADIEFINQSTINASEIAEGLIRCMEFIENMSQDEAYYTREDINKKQIYIDCEKILKDLETNNKEKE